MENDDIIITPLGTVSPYCKGDKNCPGFFIEFDNSKILLDCGSGITRLLNFPNDLNNLIIIISHLHKDHYLELGSIGYASYVYKNLGYLNKKIDVYIPDGDYVKVNEGYIDDTGWSCSKKVTKPIADLEYLNNFGEEHYLNFIKYDFCNNIKHGNMNITFRKNLHNINTYSIKIQINDKIIVYSADTGYQGNRLEEFAKNADIFICESTFLRGQTRLGNNHLYAHEAATIAKNANVKQLVLTHFWPEIEKQNYVNEAKDVFENTIAAEEGKKLVLRR